MEALHDRRVRIVRYDNGELKSIAFGRDSKNIVIEPCPRKTPEMDGMAERHIQTITNMTRCLLAHASNIPHEFWGYAFRHANYVKNLLPITSLGLLSPHEALFGHPPSVSHLRVFGSASLYHLEISDRSLKSAKFEKRAAAAIYLGAVSRDLCYLLDLKSMQLIIRRHADIVFNEFYFPPLDNYKSTVLTDSTFTASDLPEMTPQELALMDVRIGVHLENRKRYSESPLENLDLLKRKYIPVSERNLSLKRNTLVDLHQRTRPCELNNHPIQHPQHQTSPCLCKILRPLRSWVIWIFKPWRITTVLLSWKMKSPLHHRMK